VYFSAFPIISPFKDIEERLADLHERLINSRNKFTSVQVDGRKLYDEGKTFLDEADELMAKVHAARESARESDHNIHILLQKTQTMITMIERGITIVSFHNIFKGCFLGYLKTSVTHHS